MSPGQFEELIKVLKDRLGSIIIVLLGIATLLSCSVTWLTFKI